MTREFMRVPSRVLNRAREEGEAAPSPFPAVLRRDKEARVERPRGIFAEPTRPQKYMSMVGIPQEQGFRARVLEPYRRGTVVYRQGGDER